MKRAVKPAVKQLTVPAHYAEGRQRARFQRDLPELTQNHYQRVQHQRQIAALKQPVAKLVECL